MRDSTGGRFFDLHHLIQGGWKTDGRIELWAYLKKISIILPIRAL
jgi:hypothetical protein